ncbi:MAG: hypothetical protein DWI57_02045 [Chloroflexi bacterium]|nr:MAG: hypothetical protein DWI57_02045 [Chloroflexota bacterium]
MLRRNTTKSRAVGTGWIH